MFLPHFVSTFFPCFASTDTEIFFL
jgi:hypothetical protein